MPDEGQSLLALAEQRGQRAAARLTRACSARTKLDLALEATKVSIHAVLRGIEERPCEISGLGLGSKGLRVISVHHPPKEKLPILHIHRNHILRAKLAFQDQLGHRVFNALLDGAFEGAGTEGGVEANFGEFGQGVG